MTKKDEALADSSSISSASPTSDAPVLTQRRRTPNTDESTATQRDSQPATNRTPQMPNRQARQQESPLFVIIISILCICFLFLLARRIHIIFN